MIETLKKLFKIKKKRKVIGEMVTYKSFDLYRDYAYENDPVKKQEKFEAFKNCKESVVREPIYKDETF